MLFKIDKGSISMIGDFGRSLEKTLSLLIMYSHSLRLRIKKKRNKKMRNLNTKILILTPQMSMTQVFDENEEK
jgi:hypothetical protein